VSGRPARFAASAADAPNYRVWRRVRLCSRRHRREPSSAPGNGRGAYEAGQ